MYKTLTKRVLPTCPESGKTIVQPQSGFTEDPRFKSANRNGQTLYSDFGDCRLVNSNGQRMWLNRPVLNPKFHTERGFGSWNWYTSNDIQPPMFKPLFIHSTNVQYDVYTRPSGEVVPEYTRQNLPSGVTGFWNDPNVARKYGYSPVSAAYGADINELRQQFMARHMSKQQSQRITPLLK